MNDLLASALEAHGGLSRWDEFRSLKAEISIGGAIWNVKQQVGLFTDKVFEIKTHEEHLTITPFTKPGLRSVFVPDRQTLETVAGDVLGQRYNPRQAFAGHTLDTPWDKFHAAFFASEAIWTYLTLPFLYSYEGFECDEIEPWSENGEIWRRVRVTFPAHIVSHTRTQITHFGSDGLMRRHDYSVDIIDGSRGANYSTNYRDFQGIKMPTARRIYPRDESERSVAEPLLVTIDFENLTFS